MTLGTTRFDKTRLFRWLILVLAIGGGFTGLVVTVQGVAEAQLSLLQLFFSFWFVGLYAFVIASGLIFADSPRCVVPLMISLILQVPFVTSPILAYRFDVGFNVTIGVVNGHFISDWRFGSEWFASLLQGRPWGIGVNLFAVLILFLLVRFTSRNESAPNS